MTGLTRQRSRPVAARPSARHARRVGYRLGADVVMLAHFGFLAFLTAGGFLARQRPRVLAGHVLAAAWGLISVATEVGCPLTLAEEQLRLLAGQEGLPGGFIDTYLTGVIYPREHERTVQLLVVALVVASWAGCAVRYRRDRGSRRPLADPQNPQGALHGREAVDPSKDVHHVTGQ